MKRHRQASLPFYLLVRGFRDKDMKAVSIELTNNVYTLLNGDYILREESTLQDAIFHLRKMDYEET